MLLEKIPQKYVKEFVVVLILAVANFVTLIINIINFNYQLLNPWSLGITLFLVIILLVISIIMRLTSVARYHGAEHKVFNTYLDQVSISYEEVKKRKRVCTRCGTNFILYLIFFMLLFSFLGIPLFLMVLLSYFIANRTFHYLKSEKGVLFIFLYPLIFCASLFQSSFTTIEPNDEEVEVAIIAMNKLVERY